MKFRCYRDELIKGLNSVAKTIATKTTMPIQEGILIETVGNRIKLTTNDLEIGTEYVLNAEVEIQGATVVDMKTFNEIVRRIEAPEIIFEVENNNIFVIKSTSGVFKLQTMNADEYKRLPLFDAEKQLVMKQAIFKDMVKKTVFAASIDMNRPVYTGVLISVENKVLTMVALDGFRMAIKREYLDDVDGEFKTIIPAKVLTEVVKSLDDDENAKIRIGTNKNQVLFEIENCTVVSRIISGEFLNYNSVIPANSDIKINLNRRYLVEALERVAIFAKDVSEKDKKVPIVLKINMDSIEVSCVSGTGDAKEVVNAVVAGKELEIGFNPRPLIEALRTIEDEEIVLSLNSEVSPLIITPVAGTEYIYMVLPVKLK